jgi:hypothetical protein
MRERNGASHAGDGPGAREVHAVTNAEQTDAERLAHRVEELETENLRLTRRGAMDRAQADATWAARLSAERADHETACARLAAEHQTWYARFVREHQETVAALRAAETQLAAAARDSYYLRQILGSRSWRAMMPLRFIARSVRRLFGRP